MMKVETFEESRQRFDKIEKIRNGRGYPVLSDHEKDMAAIRLCFLQRNPSFQIEYNKLKKLQKKDKAKYVTVKQEIIKKWNVDQYGFPINRPLAVTAHPIPEQFYTLVLKVDLRFPKKKIMEKVKAEIDKWQDMYKEEYQEYLRDRIWLEFENQKGRQTMDCKGFEKYYQSRIHDDEKLKKRLSQQVQKMELYKKYLQIYDMRETDKKSWGEIVKDLRLDSLFNVKSNVRNCHRAARKLISEGIPGLPPFPTTQNS